MAVSSTLGVAVGVAVGDAVGVGVNSGDTTTVGVPVALISVGVSGEVRIGTALAVGV